MCITLDLKIIPNKFVIDSYLSYFAKNYIAQLFREITEPFLKIKEYIWRMFLKSYVFSKNILLCWQ